MAMRASRAGARSRARGCLRPARDSSSAASGGRYLILGGQQGALVSAPPRSGQGHGDRRAELRCSWPGSLVCLDIKLENWHLTGGFRARIGPGVLPVRSARCRRQHGVLESALLCLGRSEPAHHRSAAHRRDAVSGDAGHRSVLDRRRPRAVSRHGAVRARDAIAPADARRSAAPGHGER